MHVKRITAVITALIFAHDDRSIYQRWAIIGHG